MRSVRMLCVLACLALAGCAPAPAPAHEAVTARDAVAPAGDAPAREAGGRGAPTRGAPDQGAPDQGAPDQGAPDQGAPDHGAPDHGAPDQGLPAGPLAVDPPVEGLTARPAWLGTRVLPPGPGGFGEVPPTPPELDDRRLPPPAGGRPPPADSAFAAVVGPVPEAVAARSTWSPACPVTLDDLRYVTLSFWGFDERAHTGELLVSARVANAVVEVFRTIYAARFPIEEMRVVSPPELDAPPTGDGNNTTAFVCRSTVSSGAWSQHAYGLAVDINPFHNPYARGDIVLPELASSYVDRARHRPGMIQPGDPATQAFAGIGWGWGGNWRSAKDWMHFSHNGR